MFGLGAAMVAADAKLKRPRQIQLVGKIQQHAGQRAIKMRLTGIDAPFAHQAHIQLVSKSNPAAHSEA